MGAEYLEALGTLVLVYGAERMKTAAMAAVSDYLLESDLSEVGGVTGTATLIIKGEGANGPTR